jgi:beta-N-acetylhexosaminidase
MGYEGLIISDDLQMHAIAKHFPLNEALAKTINAGADMIIFGNQLGESSPNQVIDIIEELIHQGEIKVETIHTAFMRIKHFKQKNLKTL